MPEKKKLGRWLVGWLVYDYDFTVHRHKNGAIVLER